MRWSDVPLCVSIVCACILNGPQLLHTWRTRDVAGLSSTTMMLRVVSSASWIVYAAMTTNWLIATSACVVCISEATLLLMKWRWHGVTDTIA